MGDCREIDPLVTPYVDGEISPSQRADVDVHLAACPPCRRRAAVEAAVRRALRSRLAARVLTAPQTLRARCLNAAGGAGALDRPLWRSRLVSLSMAAALLLALGGILLYALTVSSSTVLAAQLALDHVKCFALFGGGDAREDRGAADRLDRQYGRRTEAALGVPGLELVGGRRCLYGEGALAHLMYRLQGRPISLFMLPDTVRAPSVVGALGHEAVIWSGEGRTYVLLGRQPRSELERIAAHFSRR